ncbi:MAG: GNAT family N-acetyltransferase [Planctomycetota bacterium]|nr:GNAT family N-acetyltransferase [Planctomycetota bacterium]
MNAANPIDVRLAGRSEVEAVSSILREAAAWLESRGMPLWKAGELEPERLAADVLAGMYWLAWVGATPAGCVRFQLEDPLFWPDVPAGEAAFIHRLAVRRDHAGGAVSAAILDWARGRTHELDRRWLRLDTAADRTGLRRVYERQGFQFHSERQVGPYLVARYQIEVRPARSEGR